MYDTDGAVYIWRAFGVKLYLMLLFNRCRYMFVGQFGDFHWIRIWFIESMKCRKKNIWMIPWISLTNWGNWPCRMQMLAFVLAQHYLLDCPQPDAPFSNFINFILGKFLLKHWIYTISRYSNSCNIFSVTKKMETMELMFDWYWIHFVEKN